MRFQEPFGMRPLHQQHTCSLATCMAAALLLCGRTAEALSAPKQITLDAGGCAGVAWNRLGEKYGYDAKLTSLALPSGCGAASVRISKLYVQDACIDKRDNNFEVKLEPEHVLCHKILYPDTTTCTQIMKFGPAEAILSASQLTPGTGSAAQIDRDNICYNTDKAFIFLQNNCTELVDAVITLETVSYEGERCVVVEGHALGVAGIVGISIAAAVVLLLISGILKCLCCCL